MKLAFGTVQFGIPYGINNHTGMPSDEEITEMLKYAYQQGIRVIDTAASYGDAEQKIGRTNGVFKVVSKFPMLKETSSLKRYFDQSCMHLRCKNLYGYMAHQVDALFQTPTLWQDLQNLKHEGLIQKIGYSLYSPDQLKQCLDLNFIPDLVQVPYSLLNRSFEPYFLELKSLGTEIHVRSVYLQGLYFMYPNQLPDKIKSLAPSILALQNLAREHHVSMADLALNFVLQNLHIDYVVVGMESMAQLKENIASTKAWHHNSDLSEAIKAIHVQDVSCLNPANW